MGRYETIESETEDAKYKMRSVLMSSENWVFYPKLNPMARLRLFCFPYAGGGASAFTSWPSDLPTDVEVCSVQIPGRENRLREPPYTRLAALVQILVETIEPALTKPFAFFGHSMGALISFELTRELQKRRKPSPFHLFVSGHRAPQLADLAPPLHTLLENELLQELSKFNGTPEVILQHKELLQLVLPVLRADLEMCETYIYSSNQPLECPISAFGGMQDPRVSRKELATWQEQTCCPFALLMLPGDHFFLHSSRASLLEKISWQLQQYDGL